MRPLRALPVLLFAALPAPAAMGAAEDPVFYDVEIVLFENLDVRAAENERWRPQVVVPDFEGASTFERGRARTDTMVALPRGFEQLPEGQTSLDQAVRRLEDSPRYRVVRHLLWRQPGLDADTAVPLRFHAGEPVTVRAPEPMLARPDLGPPEPEAEAEAAGAGTDQEDGDTAVNEPATAGIGPAEDAGTAPDTPFGGVPAPRVHEVSVFPLDGTIRLVVSRYLHLHANLYYTEAVDWSEEAAGGRDDAGASEERDAARSARDSRIVRGPDGRAMLTYPFVQQRRMRSGELHYLDHPILGMLVLVTPRGEEPGADAG